MNVTSNNPHHLPAFLTTEQFASLLALRPQSIRKRFNQTGSYFNVLPKKMPNGRLNWPHDSVEQLLKSKEG